MQSSCTCYMKKSLFSRDFILDVKKMPLGKLSKAQVAKGFQALEEIEEVIEKKKKGNLADLSSKLVKKARDNMYNLNFKRILRISYKMQSYYRFYTLIPHSFGRQRPPVINTVEDVRRKYDMLAILGDIVIAQTISQDAKKKSLTKVICMYADLLINAFSFVL